MQVQGKELNHGVRCCDSVYAWKNLVDGLYNDV